MVRSGSSIRHVVDEQHVDVERARTPTLDSFARRRAARCAGTGAAALADRGRSRSRRPRSDTRPAEGRRPVRSRRRATPPRRARPELARVRRPRAADAPSRSPRFDPSARYAGTTGCEGSSGIISNARCGPRRSRAALPPAAPACAPPPPRPAPGDRPGRPRRSARRAARAAGSAREATIRLTASQIAP